MNRIGIDVGGTNTDAVLLEDDRVRHEDLPIAYLPGNSLRVRLRVVGDIARSGAPRS